MKAAGASMAGVSCARESGGVRGQWGQNAQGHWFRGLPLRLREREATAHSGCHGEPRRTSGDRGKHPTQLAATAPVQAKDDKGSDQGASLGGWVKRQDLGWPFERTPL